MEGSDLADTLGELQGEYRPAMGKVVGNAIFALIWFILGFILFSLFWDLYAQRLVAVLAGLFFLVSGAAYALVPYYRRAGRVARLYEQGIWMHLRDRDQIWRFDQIDGLRVISGRGARGASGLADGIGEALPFGGLVGALVSELAGRAMGALVPEDELVGTDINAYHFYVGTSKAFEIGPEYKRWKELGMAVFVGVMRELVPAMIHRLARGERVIFDGLSSGVFGKTRLTLTLEGIQADEKPPLLWSKIVRVRESEPRGSVTIETPDKKTNINFRIDDALNAFVALRVLQAMSQEIID